MIDTRGKLAVHVGRKPEPGPDAAHKMHSVRVAQLPAVYVLLQERLVPQQLLQIAVMTNALRPVVAQHNIHAPTQKHELGEVVLPDVVAGVQRAAFVPE
jgi:hypothetical protein